MFGYRLLGFGSGSGKKQVDFDYDRNQKIIENTCGPKSLAWLMICDHYGYDTAKLV